MPSLLARAAHLLVPPFCWACGGQAPDAEPLCRPCRAELRWLDPPAEDRWSWAPVAYEGPARALVRGLKYRGAPGLAEPMGAMMAASAPAGLLGPGTVLVPVPLARARRRTRGFNQAELLARAVASRRGLRVDGCLRRTGAARRQVGRTREQRLDGLGGSVVARSLVPPSVVIVDDVITTGATLLACRAALHAAGALEVRAIAFARTPGR